MSWSTHLRALFRPPWRMPRQQDAARALDAAGGGRRWDSTPTVQNASVLHQAALTISQRAAHFAVNNAHGVKIVETLKSNLIGTGIKPHSQHANKATARALNAAFLAWTDETDADGLTDFYGLQQNALADTAIHGEALLIWTASEETGAPQLRRLHPEQLDRSMTRPIPGGGQIVQGVEFNARGKRIAYHIRPILTGDPMVSLAYKPERFPASEVIHLFRPLMPGQVRGLSWFTSLLLPGKELDSLADSMLVRAKVAALHAGFLYDQTTETPYDGQQSGTELNSSMEPGAIVRLPHATNIEFPKLPDQGGAASLMTYTLRLMAAGAGITYEQLTGDYSQVNYSSDRAAKLEFRRWAEALQHQLLVFQFCRPVWNRFIRWQALKGSISAAAVRATPEDFAAKWFPPAWAWVDPWKDAKAKETLLKLNLISPTSVINEMGYDAEEVHAEIAADAARLKALGLAPSDPAPQARALPVQHSLFRADFRPSTVNETARTVELIASTGAGVVRQDLTGPFIEMLDLTPDAVDLRRLEGMPLLDSHRQDSLDRILGVVRSARIEGGALLVTVEVSARADAYWMDIKTGIIRNVSIGYAPVEWRDSTDTAGNRIRTITRWELREVSLVPVPADPAAQVREIEGTNNA